MLSTDDNAGRFTVARGEQVVIRLAENPTTGYQWFLVLATTSPLRLLSTEFDPSPGGGTGGGGVRIFNFVAASTGAGTVELQYARAPGVPPRPASFAVTLEVTDV